MQLPMTRTQTPFSITDSIDDAKRYMGVCDAFRDVLMIAGEPIDRIGLNND